MSVYRRKNKDGAQAKTYSYDFQCRGNRFFGETPCTTKREALDWEKSLRDKAKAEVRDPTKPLPFNKAANYFWNEVGQFHANSATTFVNICWLTENIGANKPTDQVTPAVVAALITKRRNQRIPQAKSEIRLPTNATVNRSVTVLLRQILRRAAKTHKAKVAEIDWKDYMLPEPRERVREASGAEEDAVMEQLAEGYDDAVAFGFITGCRRCEIVGLRWRSVDFFSRRFTVTGKGKKVRTIPLSDAAYDLLWSIKDHDPEHVFTYVAQRTVKGKRPRVRGKRYPITESGLKTAMRRAVPRAGVHDFHFHDIRHTAATRILRASNLKVVNRLLGHSSMETTAKYAHAHDDDLRDAMNSAVARGENPAKNAVDDKESRESPAKPDQATVKPLSKKGKSA